MTRQHFEAIANAIRVAGNGQTSANAAAQEMRKEIAENIASEMGRFNSNFNRAKFLKACGV